MVRAVALFEAGKGALVIVAGLGLLSLIHQDVQPLAGNLVGHLHLNPAKRYQSIFLEAAGQITDARLWTLAALAATYAGLRFIEAYGLWRKRRWAEWLAAGSGGIYILFEIYGLYKDITFLSIALLLVNIFIVALMIQALRKTRHMSSIRPT